MHNNVYKSSYKKQYLESTTDKFTTFFLLRTYNIWLIIFNYTTYSLCIIHLKLVESKLSPYNNIVLRTYDAICYQTF